MHGSVGVGGRAVSLRLINRDTRLQPPGVWFAIIPAAPSSLGRGGKTPSAVAATDTTVTPVAQRQVLGLVCQETTGAGRRGSETRRKFASSGTEVALTAAHHLQEASRGGTFRPRGGPDNAPPRSCRPRNAKADT